MKSKVSEETKELNQQSTSLIETQSHAEEEIRKLLSILSGELSGLHPTNVRALLGMTRSIACSQVVGRAPAKWDSLDLLTQDI